MVRGVLWEGTGRRQPARGVETTTCGSRGGEGRGDDNLRGGREGRRVLARGWEGTGLEPTTCNVRKGHDCRAGSAASDESARAASCCHPSQNRYTYDHYDGVLEGQFFYELNLALREMPRAGPDEAAVIMTGWSAYMKVLTNGLRKLPNIQDLVFRGRPVGIDEMGPLFYRGRYVTFGAVTSTSRSLEFAAHLAQQNGTILRMFVHEGKSIADLSYFGREEDEVVLPPNASFVVTDEPRSRTVDIATGPVNFHRIDLQQVRGTDLLH